MRRALFAGLVVMSTVVIARPASAKVDQITEALIAGPGLGAGMRIEAPDTEGLWESGIDVAGGLDDGRADSVEELELGPADLGPRYLATYRFDFGDVLIRQNLYPYARGGPVTYTPPGQELTAGVEMDVTAGWYRSSHGFLRYLKDQGLPETNPVAPVATRERALDAAPRASMPWAGILVVLVGLAALSLAALAVRRRVLVRR